MAMDVSFADSYVADGTELTFVIQETCKKWMHATTV